LLEAADDIGMMNLSNEQVAYIAYEAHRAYCKSIGLGLLKPWGNSKAVDQQSAIIGVSKLRDNPNLTAEEIHESWLAQKHADGWKWARAKSDVEKTHPLMVAYKYVPPKHQMKDKLFIAIVKTLLERELAPV